MLDFVVKVLTALRREASSSAGLSVSVWISLWDAEVQGQKPIVTTCPRQSYNLALIQSEGVIWISIYVLLCPLQLVRGFRQESGVLFKHLSVRPY